MDSVAILVPSNTLVQQWQGKLLEHGIGSCPLTEYRGRPRPGVKVGTYNRSKGLEFKRVYLPGLTNRFPPTDRDNVDFMVQSGSQLYVAMSRARDELSVSYAANPSVFIESMRDQFNQG